MFVEQKFAEDRDFRPSVVEMFAKDKDNGQLNITQCQTFSLSDWGKDRESKLVPVIFGQGYNQCNSERFI